MASYNPSQSPQLWLHRAQREFEVEQDGEILTLSVRIDESVFVSLIFEV